MDFTDQCSPAYATSSISRSLDATDLMLRLERDGAIEDQEKIRRFSPENLCTFFDIESFRRWRHLRHRHFGSVEELPHAVVPDRHG